MTTRRLLWLALILLLLGLGAAVRERFVRVSGGGGPTVFVSAKGPEQFAALFQRLAKLFKDHSERVITVGDLRRMLAADKDDPVGRRFAEDFKKDPALRRAWERHADEEDVDLLFAEVFNDPGFAKLLSRWDRNGRLLALAEDQYGELARALGEAPGLGGRGAGSGGGDNGYWNRLGAARGAEGLHVRRVRAGGPGNGADAGSSAEKGSGADAGKGEDAGRAHDVKTRLDKLEDTGQSRDLKPWFSLCYKHDPAISNGECEAINNFLGGAGLWGSCFKAGFLGKCSSLCMDKAELKCAAQAGDLQGCLSGSGCPAQVCAEACDAGHCHVDCHPPPAAAGGGGRLIKGVAGQRPSPGRGRAGRGGACIQWVAPPSGGEPYCVATQAVEEDGTIYGTAQPKPPPCRDPFKGCNGNGNNAGQW